MRLDPVNRVRLSLGHVAVAAVWMVGALLVTGCDVASMAFFKDERVRIVEPEEQSIVTQPVTLRWEVRDFKVTGRNGQSASDAGYFAIFVDRPPIPSGKTLEWFALQEGSCGRSACGTVDKLSNIHTTEETALTLDRLLALRTRGDLERHQAVIVLLDGTGRRIGESAFRVRFNFERKA